MILKEENVKRGFSKQSERHLYKQSTVVIMKTGKWNTFNTLHLYSTSFLTLFQKLLKFEYKLQKAFLRCTNVMVKQCT